MIEYILIFILFLYLSYYYDIKGNTVGYEKWVRYCCIILILLAGFRNHVGGDTFNYINRFEQWPNLIDLINEQVSWVEISQPLWFFINCTLKTFYNDFVIVQIFHAVVVNILFFRFLKKTTSKIFIANLFIYCMVWWNFNFEIMRESLCVAIYLNSLLFLKQGSIRKFLLINIPILFIHYFSFIIIICTLITFYIKSKYYICIIGALTFGVLSVDISSVLQNELYMLYFSDEMITKVDNYLTDDFYGKSELNIWGILLQLILILQTVIIILDRFKRGIFDLQTNLLLFYLFLYVLAINVMIFSRLCNYLILILIVETINYLHLKGIRKTLSYYCVLILFVRSGIDGIINFYKPSELDRSNLSYDCRYIPYTSILETPDPIRESYYGL